MIECINVGKTYQIGEIKIPVLKNVSFKIIKGEFVAVVGPSGSGKSTLMHILGALDSPTVGKYVLEGRDVSRLSDDELAAIRKNRIGFVFQSFNLLPRATVMRNVSLPLIYNRISSAERQKKAAVALKAVGLEEERWNNLSNQLSGGQMQRVAIARALVNSPAIILADEPTGNLDSNTGKLVIDTLRELNKKNGHTIILITHDLEIAESADRIISIRDGILLKN